MVQELARPAKLPKGAAPDSAWAFLDGKFVPIREAKISVMTHAFNYGTGVFEGIRAYWNAEEEQLYGLHLHEHFSRLLRSGKIMRISVPHTADELVATDGGAPPEVRLPRGRLRPAGRLQVHAGDRRAPPQPRRRTDDLRRPVRQLHRGRQGHRLPRVVLASRRRQRHPGTGQDHRVICERSPGQERGRGGGVRRGDRADAGRPCLGGKRREPVPRP